MARIIALLSIFWAWLIGWRIGLAGLWLLVLYALFSSFVVFSFSAFQLQLAIGTYHTANSAPLALWEVQNLYSRWKVDADQLEAAEQSYRETDQSIRIREEKNHEQERNLSRIYGDCRHDIVSFMNDVEYKLEDVEYANMLHNKVESSNQCKKNYGSVFFEDYVTSVKARQSERDLDAAQKKLPVAGLSAEIKNVFDNADTKDLNATILSYVLRAEDIYKTIAFGDEQIEQYQRTQAINIEKMDILYNKMSQILTNGDGKNLDRGIGDYFIALSYFDSVKQIPLFGKLIPNFSRMPPDTLTLILVLSMGALGGTIQLSRKHLSRVPDEVIPPSYYIFRPFLGAITALSVFILIKAGVLVASIPSPGGETANLSPFFISFLGIVSGLLAEQALETIERVGARFFAESEEEPPRRWAYGLRAAMRPDDSDETYAKTLKELSNLLEKSEDQIEKWAREEEPVPDIYQKLISVFFHLPLRMIFTDLKN